MLQWILERLKPGAGLFGCDSIRKFSQLLDIIGPNLFRASHSWPRPEIATANSIPISPVRFLFLGIMTQLTTISAYQISKGPKLHDHLENHTEIEFLNESTA